MSETRRASLPLPPACQPERLLGRLQQLDGVAAARRGDGAVHIDYRFPELSFSRLWREVTAEGGRGLSLPVRLRQALRALLEDNERDRARGDGGWHARVEAIYADLYQRQAPPRSVNHLWQEYGQHKATIPERQDSS